MPWIVVLVMVVGGLFLLWAGVTVKPQARGKRAACAECWYDNSGLPDSNCPECGLTVVADSLIRPGDGRRARVHAASLPVGVFVLGIGLWCCLQPLLSFATYGVFSTREHTADWYADIQSFRYVRGEPAWSAAVERSTVWRGDADRERLISDRLAIVSCGIDPWIVVLIDPESGEYEIRSGQGTTPAKSRAFVGYVAKSKIVRSGRTFDERAAMGFIESIANEDDATPFIPIAREAAELSRAVHLIIEGGSEVDHGLMMDGRALNTFVQGSSTKAHSAPPAWLDRASGLIGVLALVAGAVVLKVLLDRRADAINSL